MAIAIQLVNEKSTWGNLGGPFFGILTAMHKQRIAILVAAGIGALAAFLPWMTLGMLSVPGAKLNGLSDGWFSFAAFILAAVLVGTGKRETRAGMAKGAPIALLGAGAVALGVLKIVQLRTIASNAAESGGLFAEAIASSAAPGVGLILTIAGGAGLMFALAL